VTGELTPQIRPVLIVGTGRCGSTMLSMLLRAHDEVLSLSEFFTLATDFGTRIQQMHPGDAVTGEALWSIIGAAHPKQSTMLRHGVAMPEVLYNAGAPGRRFTARDGVPSILQVTLPHLTGSPDVLFDELRCYVETLRPAPIGQQYQRLFTWLQTRFGRRLWVERSGGSIRSVPRLRALFPDARFVHIVRDGRDCALSMSAHFGFRMALISLSLIGALGYDPYETSDRTGAEDLSDDLFRLLPEHFDAEAFRNYEIAPSVYGHYWSGEIERGLAELDTLDDGDLLTLHYEDFLADPAAEIRRLFAFVLGGEPDEDWVQKAAATIRPGRSAWRTLPAAERDRLERACAPGFAALAQHRERTPTIAEPADRQMQGAAFPA
jgi:sulfotransferase family protein